MVNLKFLQKLFLLLFMGVTVCSLQGCSDDDEDEINESNIENNDSNKKDIVTLYKLWYLTDYSGNSDIDWQSDNVVSWNEYMEFSDSTLYWNSRMNGENTTYKLNGTINNCVSYSFTAVNINNSDDKRIITVKEMTKKYLLLYDHEEELYRGFISSYFTNLPTAGGNGDDNGSGGNDSGSSGGNDDSGEEDNEEEEEEEEEDAYRTCGVCHGSGKCNKCGGDGGSYTYGGDGWDECEYCDETGLCYVCDGTGRRKKH